MWKPIANSIILGFFGFFLLIFIAAIFSSADNSKKNVVNTSNQIQSDAQGIVSSDDTSNQAENYAETQQNFCLNQLQSPQGEALMASMKLYPPYVCECVKVQSEADYPAMAQANFSQSTVNGDYDTILDECAK